MSCRVLLVCLIQAHLCGVSEGDILVDASHFTLTVGKALGSFEQLLGDAVEVLFAGKLIVAHVHIVGSGKILVNVRHFVEKANKFKIEV